ncbi:3-phenylpropionate/cinnamic acid dioxygenase small subunit [Prauserella isguenensis]|uniref:3-phenylpropionate/cinnamic acid dioxygenase small subunit n=1 Tax=Prauserella isguenensis TaxID=1470180 RepID=A0A839S3V0_9PSEU|nr:nuclear transport factor 2 family protein [Prauserella isguenensis]MBB3052052.1 3-phenylpropionate/cinnamic acid dioxygenase small subunit [Prauserella isguenensis]
MTTIADPAGAEAARATLHRYARAVDNRDEAALALVFTEDVAFERVDGLREGRDTVLAFYRTVFGGPTVWSKHMVTNVLVEPHRDGLAVTAYFQAVSRTADDAIAVFGEYDDLLVPGGDGLRIARKRIDVQQTFDLEPRDG